ncbi:putative sterigmatocystin biosynthesis monooxygenase stcW [Cercospora zeina]
MGASEIFQGYDGFRKFGEPVATADGYTLRTTPCGQRRKVRVVFKGMGMSGIDFAHRMQAHYPDIDLVCYERNSSCGGVWSNHKYPGCACDIPSVLYQFSWHLKPWSMYYSPSDEIETYLQEVVEKYDLGKYAVYNTEVVNAEWLDSEGHWKITLNRKGEIFEDYADFFINAGGILNTPRWPAIQGLNSFEGPLTHSARYDRSIDLHDKRVLVIGVGSSGTQIVPAILNDVKHIHLVARSKTWITGGIGATWVEPNARQTATMGNFYYSEKTKKRFVENPEAYLRYIKSIENEISHRFMMYLNGTPQFYAAIERCARTFREKLANKPELVETLMPRNFAIGCRRATPGDGFLEALSTEKVTVHPSRIQEIVADGFIDSSGQKHEVDVIICATGYDTSYVSKIPMIYDGKNLQDVQRSRENLVHYMGIAEPEVPNHFIYSGPYSGYGHGSLIPTIENTTRYILKVIEKAQVEDIKKISLKMKSAQDFTKHANLWLSTTAWSGPCTSWYKSGTDTKSAPMFPGSRTLLLKTVEEGPKFEHYDIEYLSGNTFNYLGTGLHVADVTDRDLTWFWGLIDGQDKAVAPFDWNEFLKEAEEIKACNGEMSNGTK